MTTSSDSSVTRYCDCPDCPCYVPYDGPRAGGRCCPECRVGAHLTRDGQRRLEASEKRTLPNGRTVDEDREWAYEALAQECELTARLRQEAEHANARAEASEERERVLREAFQKETLRTSALMRWVKALRYGGSLWLTYAIDLLDFNVTDDVLARAIAIIEFESALTLDEGQTLDMELHNLYQRKGPEAIDTLTVDEARALLIPENADGGAR